MLHSNITNFRKNLFGILEQTIKYNEPVHIRTKIDKRDQLCECTADLFCFVSSFSCLCDIVGIGDPRHCPTLRVYGLADVPLPLST